MTTKKIFLIYPVFFNIIFKVLALFLRNHSFLTKLTKKFKRVIDKLLKYLTLQGPELNDAKPETWFPKALIS